jgi:hypothetical protein
VEIADQFEEVGLRLHHDGLVPILEEVADPVMPPVEGPRVAGEQRPHAPGQGAGPRPDEEMGMIREERPGETVRAPASASAARRATKSVRSLSSLKMARRSRPRTITWWRVSGASRRGWRGMVSLSVATECPEAPSPITVQPHYLS